ncbi:cobalamin 5'-phosphate synthase [Thermosinus carboxydivorans Nor1]|uniref:Adenosylcobinamide-GDP ribazoletransferase n=2 Tax=Thermosinus TaxID=261684 RepID=A1HPW2_9FIRM|nr:cobalamin 5'-phosphate synthase [Thermosinus carboxydivorans Nor1]
MMSDFFIALQFLTRLHIVRQNTWSPEEFGSSVKYFPLVGAVIGSMLAVLDSVVNAYLPAHVWTAMLVVIGLVLTGGLHGDGFMDTFDGLFSGRTPQRMLEIMKDSRVGANGVMAFGALLLLKWSMLLDIDAYSRPIALFIAPVIGRMAMVIGITIFPYARPEGIGKAFAQYAGKRALYIATVFTLLLIIPFGRAAVFSLVAGLVFAVLFGRYVTRIIGGLTGDIYGAITEMTEALTLFVFIICIEMEL